MNRCACLSLTISVSTCARSSGWARNSHQMMKLIDHILHIKCNVWLNQTWFKCDRLGNHSHNSHFNDEERQLLHVEPRAANSKSHNFKIEFKIRAAVANVWWNWLRNEFNRLCDSRTLALVTSRSPSDSPYRGESAGKAYVFLSTYGCEYECHGNGQFSFGSNSMQYWVWRMNRGIGTILSAVLSPFDDVVCSSRTNKRSKWKWYMSEISRLCHSKELKQTRINYIEAVKVIGS